MDLFDALCRHPLNSLVAERGGKQNGGFVARAIVHELRRNGAGYIASEKTFALEGITDHLKATFWPNYYYTARARSASSLSARGRGRGRGRAAAAAATLRESRVPRTYAQPYQRAPRGAPVASARRMSGRERGSMIHSEIQIASKVVSAEQLSVSSAASARATSSSNILSTALAVTSTVLASNGNRKRTSVYTEAILGSMLHMWRWRPLDAEFTVGDVRADPKTRQAIRVGRFATRIDFVGLNERTQRLILAELKTGSNAGSFYASTGRMKNGLALGNSPLNQAKVQLVMGACMLVTQFCLDMDVLLDQIIELYVVHCPTRAGETVKAEVVTPDEITQIFTALVQTRTLVAHAPAPAAADRA